MTAQIIDGRAVAAALRENVAARASALPYRPGLAVVLVGDDPASRVYVRNKDKAALQVGLHARTIALPADTTEAALLALIKNLNDDPQTDGILVQLPLPAHIRSDIVLRAIDPAKDVDGFHPDNVAALALGEPGLVPCTPRGILRLLEHAQIPLRGAKALVIGRSNIVGKPVAALLVAQNATVTIAHSATRDLAGECRRAEIVIAAVGRAEMVRGDWIAPGATLIDVGINRTDAGTLVGDIAYAEALPIAGAITPVPGGVGPMTIACLLENTLTAAIARRH
ncbi:MAG TPA: bifunctional methylenetetrahydrofolate dehydrogenase/methenyltetrahydrofolate cyclohydrolase FolD [Acidiphilium sp.]|nr:MAG: bifunctional methylenetetrahydrofolate dehydrogenase/methenyltetrahydrofolate cyclohydrolase [Acidiphilium sp. 21-60-14]OYV89960.1 MAG: bifunctional methylenetetrahydrofolate dehydrogenase/methenyltetrahydrofolate cyclohydrolase [Acidiphilium sp. 37-60-79]OZB40827.1 MAG: bifunctional methylenetetrahydrofolate dehydrogenase/methenyltetrahydrofolate cyclohydrolase [Acidiphilium sp. 34-60-192]HQT88524.1 bifunctional methylenetetrahydrofolate dehydrogenase/methenyltetrahydrofolate cyclohydro